MNFQDEKQALRRQTRESRINLVHREDRSTRIQQATLGLPALRNAREIMVYVGYRSEVATQKLIRKLLQSEKTVYVPWCEENELKLFRLESFEELQPGAYDIPEPPVELRDQRDRQGSAETLDLIFVPGLAFDRRGNRLGQGKGYYDRLLSAVSDECILIGLAFGVQLVEKVPTEAHDVPLDLIVTEDEVIRCP
ncbi:MAG: 5-formyltetrahydrofolate cyclo-ligase [Planctomycetaceae bacterium]|nr:5-formyltetrahydrofolate cyclo-ligase [Planctomycetaceae bacterium]